MRNLLEQLQDVCNELRDDHEIAIIKKYGIKAKRCTTVVICKIIEFIVIIFKFFFLRYFKTRLNNIIVDK